MACDCGDTTVRGGLEQWPERACQHHVTDVVHRPRAIDAELRGRRFPVEAARRVHETIEVLARRGELALEARD
jgi:hypothetical protein